jgi:hypothetical protein
MNGGGLYGFEGGPFEECARCGSSRFAAVTNGVDTNYRCETCWTCWSVSFGRATAVDPVACPCGDAGHCRGMRLHPPASLAPGSGSAPVMVPGRADQGFNPGLTG